MIAASHIASNASINEASSARSNAHRDAGEQSFHESLGAAKQQAEVNRNTGSAPQHKVGSGKDTQTEKLVKRAKRNDSADSIDTSHLQRIDETDSNPATLQLPTNFCAVVSEDQGQFSDAISATNSEHVTTIPDSPMQGSAWLNLKSGPGWGQQPTSASPVSLDSSDIAAASSQVDDSDDAGSADRLPVTAQNLSATPSTTDVTVPAISQDSILAKRESTDPAASANHAAAAAASAAQVSAASTQSAPVANDFQHAVPSGAGISAVSASKASNAFKAVQSLKSSPKNPALSTSLPAGAKETDSYLSIQKETKTSEDASKDSPATTTLQHTDRSQATQQSFVSPVATPIQGSPALNSHAHQQPVAPSVNDTSVASQQKAQDTSLSSQLQQAAGATPTASTEHLSTVVNSAKLMQSISQSEMRVGMRTAEFGDISIRTSSSHDSISAQISLGHEDLAKTLTAHMPEMQTRLTTGELVDVQIHSGNQDSSFTGGQSGANNGSAQNHQQDNGSSRSSAFSTYTSERSTIAAMPAVMAASAASNSSRLDIRA